MTRPVKSLALIAGALCASLTAPVAAQTLSDPAVPAQPVNAAHWQRAMARELPADQRFRGLPELRFGLVVGTRGEVRACLPLPADERQPIVAQDLCRALVGIARFTPAADAAGQPIDSVFVAEFAATRPTVAADFAGVPIP